MINATLKIDHIVFANFLVPSRLLQPVVPNPLILNKIIYRFRYHSYLSAVLVSYRGLQLNGSYLPLPILQLNYRTYVQLYLTPSIYFLHSFVSGVPDRLRHLFDGPFSFLHAKTVVERREPDGCPSRMRVDGQTEKGRLAIHLDCAEAKGQRIDPQLAADLVDRGLGLYQRSDGRYLFLKVSHPPLNVRPAHPLLLALPTIPGLADRVSAEAVLSSMWVSGPAEFSLNVGYSLMLDLIGHMVHPHLA